MVRGAYNNAAQDNEKEEAEESMKELRILFGEDTASTVIEVDGKSVPVDAVDVRIRFVETVMQINPNRTIDLTEAAVLEGGSSITMKRTRWERIAGAMPAPIRLRVMPEPTTEIPDLLYAQLIEANELAVPEDST